MFLKLVKSSVREEDHLSLGPWCTDISSHLGFIPSVQQIEHIPQHQFAHYATLSIGICQKSFELKVDETNQKQKKINCLQTTLITQGVKMAWLYPSDLLSLQDLVDKTLKEQNY